MAGAQTGSCASGRWMVVLVVLGLALPTRDVRAQFSGVRGDLGVRYERLDEAGGDATDHVLGQARIEVTGFLGRPSLGTFAVTAEDRNGLVAAPPQYGLIVMGQDARMSQALARVELRPWRSITVATDGGVSRVATAGAAPSVLRFVGAGATYHGSASAPSVSATYRVGDVLAGGSATRAAYRIATVDVSKSGERSSVSGGVRVDTRPHTYDQEDRSTLMATASAATSMTESTQFDVLANYTDGRGAQPLRAGTVVATLAHRPAGRTAVTAVGTMDFSDAIGTQTRRQHVRVEGLRPVTGRLSLGAGAAVTRLETALPQAAPTADVAYSVTARGDLGVPVGANSAQISSYVGLSRIMSAERTPSTGDRLLLYGLYVSVPYLRADGLTLAVGGTAAAQRPLNGGRPTSSVAATHSLSLSGTRAHATVTALYVRSDIVGLLTDPGTPTAGGVFQPYATSRGTVSADGGLRLWSRWMVTANLYFDRELQPFDRRALTAHAQLAYTAPSDFQAGVDAHVYRYPNAASADYAGYGLFVVRRYRLLESRLDVRLNRPLGPGGLPSRSFVAAYISRAFASRFR